MKPRRNPHERALQHARNIACAPKVSRFALGKIVKMFGGSVFRWCSDRIYTMSHGRFDGFAASGGSMEPTYDLKNSITGSLYGIKKIIPSSELQRGMFVSFGNHFGNVHGFSKRLIGLPGDIVRTESHCINNRYVKVPPGTVWVEGDAGKLSYDSTQFGPVPLENFRGTMHFILYPFRYWGRVRWWEFQDKIEKTKIVTDPKEVRRLEGENKAKLEFVADWEDEGYIIKNLVKKQGRMGAIEQQAAAIIEKVAQFLREADVLCAVVRANKAQAQGQVTTMSGKRPRGSSTSSAQAQKETLLERWQAHGARIWTPEKDVFVLTLPTSTSEEDRGVLRKKANHTKTKTGCSYQFIYAD